MPIEITGSSQLKGKFTVSLYLDRPSNGLDSGKILLKTETINWSLRTGKSASVPIELKSLPSEITAGDYYFVSQFTDPDGDSDIVASSNTISIASPVISLSATATVISPAELNPGKEGSFILTIANTENATARGILNISVETAGTGILIGEQKVAAAISPQTHRRYKIRITISKNMATGVVDPVAIVSLAGVSTVVDLTPLTIPATGAKKRPG